MTLRKAIGIALILVASYLGYKKIDSPMLWLFPAWAGVAVWLLWRSSSTRNRMIAFNVALALAFLFVAEWVASTSPLPHAGQVLTPKGTKLHIPHPTLGYVGNPSVHVVGTQIEDGRTVFRVDYELDEHGMRAMASEGLDPTGDCALFLGGSLTFGEGVEADETLPSRFQASGAGRWIAHNFGISGYGAHTMLAAIQEGAIEDVSECRPRWVVYQHIQDHVRRAAGRAPWDLQGPRFEIDDQGRLERRGQFDGKRAPRWLRKLSDHSHIVRVLRSKQSPMVHEERDYDRLFAIIARLEEEVRTRWPEAAFRVVTWVEHDSIEGERFARAPWKTIWVVDSLPGANDPDSPWRLARQERHPNAAAYIRINELLLDAFELNDDSDATVDARAEVGSAQ